MRLRTLAVSLVSIGALLLTGCSGGGDPAPGASSGGASGDPSSSGEPVPDPPDVPGMVVLVSDASMADTLDRLERAIGDLGEVLATVDHAAAARSVGLDLDPTVLLIGGSPEAGTPVMAESQQAGLDLPQKFLVWEKDGVVYVGYNTAAWIAQQAGVRPGGGAFDTLRFGSAAIAAAASAVQADADSDAEAGDQEIEETSVPSDADFDETVSRLETAFDDAGLMSPLTVDHAAGADSVGADLRATTVTFAGDPEAGTPLMQQDQTMGIDLPLRFLVTEDAAGAVAVSYPDIADLAARHGIDDESLYAGIADAQASLAGAATGG